MGLTILNIFKEKNNIFIQRNTINKLEREIGIFLMDQIKTGLRKNKGWSQESNTQISPLISWMILGKLLHIYVPQLPIYKTGIINFSISQLCCKDQMSCSLFSH